MRGEKKKKQSCRTRQRSESRRPGGSDAPTRGRDTRGAAKEAALNLSNSVRAKPQVRESISKEAERLLRSLGPSAANVTAICVKKQNKNRHSTAGLPKGFIVSETGLGLFPGAPSEKVKRNSHPSEQNHEPLRYTRWVTESHRYCWVGPDGAARLALPLFVTSF